ncbi:DUF7718 family protein [Halobaculum magnesiiphilum]|uniref:DUF7718 domain-containing protein n=1 Tax=Halobaculum magnesiiphilum TaxID=1017351 RepID=A0A8T8W969_9EURY|nr:hypothetical protein [Halobaculum magnesiiphilum]QZP36378.1 hypothetical protein K6T50_08510 [Halobaculum magnesiiphilum]
MDGGELESPTPDRSYTAHLDYGRVRRRTELGVEEGDVLWFVVQLECNHAPEYGSEDDWQHVARFDHHPHMDWGHDITDERLHIDLYAYDDLKVDVQKGFPEVPVNRAPAYCERFFDERYEELLAEYHERSK